MYMIFYRLRYVDSLNFMSIRSKVKLSAWLACYARRQNNQLRVALRGRWNRGWLNVAAVAAGE